MDELKRYYSEETMAKLEQLASFTSYQPYHAFDRRLLLLQIAALALDAVEQSALQGVCDQVTDIGAFVLKLDEAGMRIATRLQELLQGRTGQAEGIDALLVYLDEQKYFLSRHYFERRARIASRGKDALLASLSAKMANR